MLEEQKHPKKANKKKKETKVYFYKILDAYIDFL